MSSLSLKYKNIYIRYEEECRDVPHIGRKNGEEGDILEYAEEKK